MPASALPLTTTPRSSAFWAWYLADRNKRRRQAARAEDGQVISSYCTGTTLTEIINYGAGRVEMRTTADSPTCGGSGAGGDGLLTEGDDSITTEGDDRLIIE